MPFKKLTDEQRDAVEYSGNLLLTACPGSGKTKTLVSKLAYMLKNKDDLGIKKRKDYSSHIYEYSCRYNYRSFAILWNH